MSARAQQWVMANSSATGLAYYVHLTLAWHLNEETGRCDPSLSTIASETRISLQSARRAIVKLEKPESEDGLHEITRIMPSGGRKTTQYVLQNYLSDTAVLIPLRQELVPSDEQPGPRPKQKTRDTKPKPPEDPKARELTLLALAQTPKPPGEKAFFMVRGVIKAMLKAEVPTDQIELTIHHFGQRHEIITWSIAGFTTAISKARSAGAFRGANAGRERVTSEVAAFDQNFWDTSPGEAVR